MAYDDDVDEKEIPPELEKLWHETEEAMVSYTQSRNKMTEFARARGFYPVVAMMPGDFAKEPFRKGKGKSKGNGKGKGKGKKRGKSSSRPKPSLKAKGSPKGSAGRTPYRPQPKARAAAAGYGGGGANTSSNAEGAASTQSGSKLSMALDSSDCGRQRAKFSQ